MRLILLRRAAEILVLRIFLGLRRPSRWIHRRPTAVVPLAPVAVRIFLVHIAVGARIHVIVIGILGHERAVTVFSGHPRAFAAFRSLKRSRGSVCVGHVLRRRPVVTVGDDRTTPLAIGVVPLRRGRVRSGPRIVSLRIRMSAVCILRRYRTSVHSGRWVVPGRGAHRTIRTVHRVAHAVETGVRVVDRRTSVGIRIRIVNRIARAVINVRRIVISSPVHHRRANRHSQNKYPQVSARITGLHRRRRRIRNHHVCHVVNRRARRNRIDNRRHRICRLPWPCRASRHEPNSLVAQIINVADSNHPARCVHGIKHRRAADRHELWFAGVHHLHRSFRRPAIHHRRGRHLR